MCVCVFLYKNDDFNAKLANVMKKCYSSVDRNYWTHFFFFTGSIDVCRSSFYTLRKYLSIDLIYKINIQLVNKEAANKLIFMEFHT